VLRRFRGHAVCKMVDIHTGVVFRVHAVCKMVDTHTGVETMDGRLERRLHGYLKFALIATSDVSTLLSLDTHSSVKA
jgi:hypothetical protein